MSAYVIVHIDIHDPEVYERYKQLTPATIEAYGGRFVVRGGPVETLEGEARPARVVVLAFESVERAKAWWASPEYEPAKALRQQSATTHMVVVEGV